MNRQLLLKENPALFLQHKWGLEDTLSTLFRCTRWQVEETMDPINCPYHYFCDITHPAENYPPAVDILLLLFTTASYLATLILLVTEVLLYRGGNRHTSLRRYLLPSGPVSLSIFLLALAKGKSINTLFPLSCVGPAILQLIQISALAFDNNASDEGFRYAFLKLSTISGILHASLYLDTTILPYYTGFDVLVSSTFSGECISCVCRKEVLVVGGKLVSYRGWSKTTVFVLGALCLRIICKLSPENKDKTILIKSVLENLGWILITLDCVYLIMNSPPERSLSRSAAFAGVFMLIFLRVLGKACTQLTQRSSTSKSLIGRESHL